MANLTTTAAHAAEVLVKAYELSLNPNADENHSGLLTKEDYTLLMSIPDAINSFLVADNSKIRIIVSANGRCSIARAM